VTDARYLIFDLDGTLIDSSAGVIDAVNYSLRMTGRAERSGEDIRRYIGFPLKQMYADFGVGPFDQLYQHFQHRAADTVVAASVSLSGADETVRLLHQRGFTMGIATTKVRRHLHGIVDKLGWSGFFSALVGGDEVAAPKPHPEAFHLAMTRLGARPEETIVVGDTTNDVLAAHDALIRVVAVVSPYGGHDDLLASRPDYVIDSIAELPLLLGECDKRKEAV
jgi:pyrophosphatase PpaX